MLQWFAENVDGIKAIITISVLVAAYGIKALINWGWVGSKKGKLIVQSIEDVEGVVTRAQKLIAHKKKKDSNDVLSDAEIAEIVVKALKGEIRERTVKTGIGKLITSITHDAADADPKKTKPTIAMKVRNVLPLIGG